MKVIAGMHWHTLRVGWGDLTEFTDQLGVGSLGRGEEEPNR